MKVNIIFYKIQIDFFLKDNLYLFLIQNKFNNLFKSIKSLYWIRYIICNFINNQVLIKFIQKFY